MSPTSTIIDPSTLSPNAREAFTAELFAAHCRIFAGVDRATFAAYVVDSPAERTRIQVFRDEGEIVGYAAFHAFEREHEGRPCLVLRTEVGLLPAYRRGTRMGGFLVREVMGVLLRNPGRAVYGLSCATNPASYRALTRDCDRVWPHWERPTPPATAALMTSLAERFGLEPVEGACPGVYHVGWKTLQDEHERRQWRACSHPASQLYVQRNPGYSEGHGMLILIELDPLGMLRCGLRLLARQLGRAWARVGTGRVVPALGSPTADGGPAS